MRCEVVAIAEKLLDAAGQNRVSIAAVKDRDFVPLSCELRDDMRSNEPCRTDQENSGHAAI